MSEPRLLLVEDDPELAQLVSGYLGRNGLAVEVEANGTRAIERILREQPDVVVLDVMLEGDDGLTVCRRVREGFAGPILMYSARGDEIDQVVGLEVGADDYVPKPASPRLLLAKVKALLRRGGAAERPTERVEEGELVIDRTRREVTLRGAAVELSTAEFDLLWELARHAGEPLDRQHLMKALRGIDYDGLDRSMDVRVSQLRKKLDDETPPFRFIKTVRGVGYQFAKSGR